MAILYYDSPKIVLTWMAITTPHTAATTNWKEYRDKDICLFNTLNVFVKI